MYRAMVAAFEEARPLLEGVMMNYKCWGAAAVYSRSETTAVSMCTPVKPGEFITEKAAGSLGCCATTINPLQSGPLLAHPLYVLCCP